MNLPVSQPQLRTFAANSSFQRRQRIVTCRAAAASWSPPLGKSSPQRKTASQTEQLKAAQQPADDAAVPGEGTEAEAMPVHRRSQLRDDALPLSLYTPYARLPEDGRTQSEFDATCDPMTRNCQTVMHVWESTCRPCWGTGSISSSSRRGRRTSFVCPTCHGLGAVRKTSSRVIPDVNGGNGQFTAGRPAALPEKEEKPDPQARLDRWRSRRKR